MIVCHCHAVTDRQIRSCIRAGACSLEQIADCTGAGSHCGGCEQTVTEILEEATAPAPLAPRRLAVLRDPQRAA